MTKRFQWSAGSGRPLYVELTKDEAASGMHQGACDSDIAALRELPHIAAQLAQWEPKTLAAELNEYGAWEPEELADHDANLNRMLWLACGDINENPQDNV